MDWSLSNRQDMYRFEMVSPHNLEASLGDLTGVIPAESSLTWGYYTDLQTKGTLSISDSNYITNALVRVWHTASVNGQTETRELGTYFVDSADAEYRFGRWSGVLELYSPLLVFDDDLLSADCAVAAGSMAAEFFSYTCVGAGATPYVYPHLQDAAFTSSGVFKFGEKSRKMLQHAASYLDCRVGVDTHGRVTLEPYQSPSLKSIAYDIPTGGSSVTLTGVSRTETRDSTLNRVVLKYEKDDITLYAHADVPPQHFASFERCGRRKTKSYDIDEMQPATQDRLQAMADHYLLINTSAPTKYEIDTYCLPIRCGDVVRLTYRDSVDDGIDIDGMVQQIDMALKPGARMQVVLDEVRRRR